MSLRAFVRAWLDELCARPAGSLGLLRAPLPRPACEPAAWAALASGAELTVWDPPGAEGGGRRWSFAGWGEAARIEGAGEARLDEVRAAAARLFASVTERRDPALEVAPRVRLFGGAAFRPEPERAAPWTGFADASFTLPRWLVGASGDHAFLQLALRPEEVAGAGQREAIERGLDRLEAALASPSPPVPAGATLAGELERLPFEEWSAMVRDALGRIRAGELLKVVPMSVTRVRGGEQLSVGRALAQLAAFYPGCTRFAFQRGAATFAGASPERLVCRRARAVESDALAGTAPRRGDDEAARAALLGSDKERREHAAVVEAIRAALGPLCAELRVPAVPGVRSLRNVHHLHTPIAGTLAKPAHVLELVRALHPTPAVAGTPREAALSWIAAHEPASRGWYAGAVGWFDAEGDGAFSVAIRSAVLEERQAWLYAGAGVVEGSEPRAEYEETRIKLAPMLAALGLSP